jgi:WD40 repeat protein
VAFSPDGKRLMGVTWGGSIVGPKVKPTTRDHLLKVWDAQTVQELRSVPLKGAEGGVVLSPDGKRLAGLSDRDKTMRYAYKTLKVWDAQTGQVLFSLSGGGSSSFSPHSGVFSADGKRVAGVVSKYDEKGKPVSSAVIVWDAQSGQKLVTCKGDCCFAVLSPDGKRVAGERCKSDEKGKFVSSEVIVWDAQTGKELFALKGHTDMIWKVDFSPDGKRLVSVSDDNTLKVWDAQSGRELFSLKEQSDGFFSPDGKRLATVGEGSTTPRISVWDALTGQVIVTLQGHTSWVDRLAFSPDGKRLASSSNDQTLRIWDLQTGQAIRTLKGQSGGRSLIFSSDGKRLVSAGFGRGGPVGVVKIWDAQKEQKDQHSFTLK